MSDASQPPPSAALQALVLDAVEDAVFCTDLENRVTFWANSAERMFGYTTAEALGRPFGELLPFRIEGTDEAGLLTAVREGRTWRGEGRVRLPDGREIWIESRVRPILTDDRIVGSVSISRDRTAAHAAERALRTLSAVNRALVRTSEEAALLTEVCQAAVEEGGYRFAWVGYAEHDDPKTLRPMAFAGVDHGYLDRIQQDSGERQPEVGAAAAAVGSGRAQIVREAPDPHFAPWGDAANGQRFAAVAALPLRDERGAFGVLAVYAVERDAFDAAEEHLLEEMADDLAFGIRARRTETAHALAVAAVAASEERYRTVVNSLAEGILVGKAGGVVVAANRAARAILGRRVAVGASCLADWEAIREDGSRFPPEEYPMAVTLRTGSARRNVVLGLRRRDRVRWIAFHTETLHTNNTERGVVASFEDVTEYRAARAEQVFRVQQRAALREATAAVQPSTTLEETAQIISEQLASLPGVDLAGLAAFSAPDELRILAVHLPAGAPRPIADRLSGPEAAEIHARAQQGSWSRRTSDLPPGGILRRAFLALGVRALAVGPVMGSGAVEGVLVIGTRDEEFAHLLVEKLPAVPAFSATSSALLAERMAARRRETDLRTAIERTIARRAFRTVYQPIVDLESREVVAYEALTRFEDGSRPDQKFREAWGVGLGPELELVTLEAAITGAEDLPAGRWLSLNVAPRLLADADRLRPVLERSTRLLVLEVTEHEAVADYGALRDATHSLGAGIRIAVDDAGAGAANFSHMVELRPDFVKLDIGLVRGVNTDIGRQALLAAMRQFARNAGCRLIAEGVETEQEAGTLAGFGVDFGQGYLFGRPAAADGA